jgi:hypothetical protein
MRLGFRITVAASILALLVAPVLHLSASPQPKGDRDSDGRRIRHVLLISIDGMHSIDFINCAEGLTSIDGGASYCPNLADLKEHGINYLDASTSKPSDSFPGLTAIVSGGSPRTYGAFYDVAYDRSLAPPAKTTGNGVAAGTCTPGVFNGTTTEYEEGIDKNQQFLNGVDGISTAAGDGNASSIDSTRLPRDPAKGCQPVFPWNFVRTNTIFGVIHAAGGYTSWFDKHPAYSSVSGPGAGPNNLDDFYSPEINSVPVAVNLPGCTPLPDQTAVASSNAWTDSFANIRCYDTLKVNGILNQIDGFNHNRSHTAPVPEIFGMNFQAVSVGQKLIEKSISTTGGYLDAMGTPTASLLAQIKFVDASIGAMIKELKKNDLYDSTLIIITAKHGQSPVDSARYTGITASGPVTTSPATILDGAGLLPLSESPSNPTGIGPTEDDVSLLWLADSNQTANAVSLLEKMSPATSNVAGVGQIFVGPGIRQLFNAPGLPPDADPRTPDIIVTPNVGVTYSGSTKKLAEHGGFAHDDTSVMLLMSNPSFKSGRITSPVGTAQVAPTILKALGLDPKNLDAVRIEGTQVLPGMPDDDRN